MSPNLYLIVMVSVCVVAFIISFFGNRKRLENELAAAIKQDISLARMQDAEEKVSDFLLKNGMPPGEDIAKIGEVLHVYEGDEDSRILNQAHLSPPAEDGRMTVTFQKGLSRPEKIFAFAHECGHIINGDNAPIDRPDGKHKPETEQTADYIAAALLMPLDDVYTYLIKNKYRDGTPRNRVRLTKALCKRYGVSEIIALRRIREVFALKNMI